MNYGIDPKRVYAEDGNANPAFWTVFPGHVHQLCVQALKQDVAIQAAIQAKLAAPNDDQKRLAAIDLIDRATVNCIGQHIVGEALDPEQTSFTIYNLLNKGTSAAINSVIDGPENTVLHKAFAAEASDQIIDVISRQTGRALFQTCMTQLSDFAVNQSNLVSTLKGQLLKTAEGAVLSAL